MKTRGLIIAAALAIAAGAAANSANRQSENEARLAQMLEGRAAGEPVSCLAAYDSSHLEVIEDVALVYKSGPTLYVARPTNPEALGRDDVVVINRFGGQLCHTDIIRTVDRGGGFTTGVLFLGKWVPYSKQD
jgi:hypothetical protein